MVEDAPTGKFVDQERLRAAFLDYEHAVAVENARRAAVLAGLFMLAGTTLDWVVFPDHAFRFLLIRAVCSCLLAGVFVMLGRIKAPAVHEAVSQSIALLPMLSISVMIAETGGGNSVYYAGLNLVLVGLSLLLRWSFLNSFWMSVACLASYLGAVYFSENHSDWRILFNNSYFIFVTSVFVLAGSYAYERLRFREFALRKEVEASRELLESQNRQLSELDEAKTRFFANISHELRTPLTVMLGISERLGKLPALTNDPRGAEMTQLLGQNGLRLLKLIDDLLDLKSLEHG
ncbi:MAG: hypothetical protein CFE26_14875, partial [Verrucomicrobiales bacterium VVV1]